MTSPGNGADAATVEGLLRTLSVEPSVLRLSAIAENNAKLKDENARLDELNTALSKQIQGLQNKLDKAEASVKANACSLKTAAQAKTDLAARLEKLQAKLQESEKKARDLENGFALKETELKEDVEEAEAELQRLEKLAVALKPVDDNLAEIRKALDALSSEALGLAGKYSGVNLPDEILADGRLWAAISEHNSNGADIPLPRSNSTCGKRMRVAVVVSILGDELHKHVFRPTYLPNNATGFHRMLMTLATSHPVVESHLRSVLLRATEMQARDAGDAVDTSAAKSILGHLSPMIPEHKQGEFQADVQQLCKTALETWQLIETLEDHIDPELGQNRQSKLKCEWMPLRFKDPPPPPSSASPSNQKTNGTAAPGPAQPKKAPASAAQQPREGPATDLKNGTVVWPAFYNLSATPPCTLAEGFVLPPSLMKAAEEEEQRSASASAAVPATPHRAAREQERNVITKRRRPSVVGVNGQTEQGKQTGKVPFLSNGSGAGSKDA